MARQQFCLPRSLKLPLYAASVCTTLTHGSEAWMLTPIGNAQRSQLTATTPHHMEVVLPSYDILTAEPTRRHQWLGHILRSFVCSFVCDLMTTVVYINVQFVQPVCCCLVQGKKVTIALCVRQNLMTYSAVCLTSRQLHAASSRSPIFCIMCPKRPWPVRSRFRRTQQCR